MKASKISKEGQYHIDQLESGSACKTCNDSPCKCNVYKVLTIEVLKDAFEHVSAFKPVRRQVVLSQHCKTKGIVTISIGNMLTKICQDKECVNCRNIENMIKKEVLKLTRPSNISNLK